ncbi:MAG TPA: hypothetical protein PLW71_03550, partial [Candidatus Syntrophosphaera thermopropionivorans]|nr:hypothetical protein [Candidatus Syntrophosphaera thermopropionivorans]
MGLTIQEYREKTKGQKRWSDLSQQEWIRLIQSGWGRAFQEELQAITEDFQEQIEWFRNLRVFIFYLAGEGRLYRIILDEKEAERFLSQHNIAIWNEEDRAVCLFGIFLASWKLIPKWYPSLLSPNQSAESKTEYDKELLNEMAKNPSLFLSFYDNDLVDEIYRQRIRFNTIPLEEQGETQQEKVNKEIINVNKDLKRIYEQYNLYLLKKFSPDELTEKLEIAVGLRTKRDSYGDYGADVKRR